MPFAIALDQTYTYGDYRDWPEDERSSMVCLMP